MIKSRKFLPLDRYHFDVGPCSYRNGFCQIDTAQDASYYGTWVNPDERKIVNYAEGDVHTTECETDAELVEQLRELAAWNDRQGWGPAKIDPGVGDTATYFRQRFAALGVTDLLH